MFEGELDLGMQLRNANLEWPEKCGCAVKIAANTSSFALYVSLGFIPVDCWTAFEGRVTSEQASSASHSVGYQPLTGD